MKKTSIFLMLSFSFILACQKDEITRQPDTMYQPDVHIARFPNGTNITNPYFPVADGKKYTYEGQTSDGLELVEEHRLPTTRIVQGIECIVVNFKAYLDGNLIEEAYDWYAQDIEGTVWYFGEEVDNYNPDGTFRDHGGSWEAGIDDAKAGIIMPANPTLGLGYREEYYFNEAEDEAEILGVNLLVSIPFGNFSNSIQTRNWTELEPDLNENKYYAPGIGLIKEVNLADNTQIVLISIQ